MICHEMDYEILGHDMQIVEVEIRDHAPSAGGSGKGEGSVLGKLGDLLDGN